MAQTRGATTFRLADEGKPRSVPYAHQLHRRFWARGKRGGAGLRAAVESDAAAGAGHGGVLFVAGSVLVALRGGAVLVVELAGDGARNGDAVGVMHVVVLHVAVREGGGGQVSIAPWLLLRTLPLRSVLPVPSVQSLAIWLPTWEVLQQDKRTPDATDTSAPNQIEPASKSH